MTREYAIHSLSGTITQNLSIHTLGDTNGGRKLNIGDVANVYAHTRGRSIQPDYGQVCADISVTQA